MLAAFLCFLTLLSDYSRHFAYCMLLCSSCIDPRCMSKKNIIDRNQKKNVVDLLYNYDSEVACTVGLSAEELE